MTRRKYRHCDTLNYDLYGNSKQRYWVYFKILLNIKTKVKEGSNLLRDQVKTLNGMIRPKPLPRFRND